MLEGGVLIGRCGYWMLRLLVLFLRSCYRRLVTGTAGPGSPGSPGVVSAIVSRSCLDFPFLRVAGPGILESVP
jgi:hypothetical protein